MISLTLRTTYSQTVLLLYNIVCSGKHFSNIFHSSAPLRPICKVIWAQILKWGMGGGFIATFKTQLRFADGIPIPRILAH